MPRVLLFTYSLLMSLWSVPGVSTPDQHIGCEFHKHIHEARSGNFGSFVRPDAVDHIDSVRFPLRVHRQEDVTPEYAAEILAYAEESWRVIVGEMGFYSPHLDGELGGLGDKHHEQLFDIYIVTDLNPGIGGYASFSGFNEDTERADAYGYLVINNEIDIRIRRFVVAHEFFHASQMAYDWWEDISFMEGSATWIGDHVFDDENIYWRYFPFFNQEPWLAHDFISLQSPYQYGAGLFSLYLDEAYGDGTGSVIKSIWEHSVQNEMDNEPDFFDAIDEIFKDQGGLKTVYRRFGEWRTMVGSRNNGNHFSEGHLWDHRMDPYFEAVITPATQSLSGRSFKPLGPFGQSFLSITPGTHASVSKLTIRNTGFSQTIAVDMFDVVEGKFSSVGDLEPGENLEVSFSSGNGRDEKIVIVTSMGSGEYDADTSSWEGERFHFEYRID